jgi:hypothetical protein
MVQYLYLGPVLGDTAIIDDSKITVLSVPLANTKGYSICFTSKLTCNITDGSGNVVLSVALSKRHQLYYAPLEDIVKVPC